MTNSVGESAAVVVFIRDLIFETKIRSTAGTIGIPVRCVRTVTELKNAIRATPLAVIVDLNASPDSVDVVLAAVQVPPDLPADQRPWRVTAFVSHVDQSLADAALAAGADEVLPRSRFVQELPNILGRSKDRL